jgi:hypothetical protein
MLYLDGVYAEDNYGNTRFHPIKGPKKNELNSLTHRISHCVPSITMGIWLLCPLLTYT